MSEILNFSSDGSTALSVAGEKKMTLQEVASATGAAYSTVASYAQKAGWTENGKKCLLSETQATIILEAMKEPVSSGTKSNLLSQTEGVSTSKSRALQIEKLRAQIEVILKEEIAELQEKVEDLQVQLDESTTWCTMKKFNAVHKLGITPRKLGAISTKLGLLGYERQRVIEDPNFKDGVWSYRMIDLEKYFTEAGVL
jgi:hypothetical protein